MCIKNYIFFLQFRVEDVIVTKEFFLNTQFVQTYVEVFGMLCRVKASKSVLVLTIHGHLCSCNIKAMTCVT
jgi:aminoglycoside phosphotransferase